MNFPPILPSGSQLQIEDKWNGTEFKLEWTCKLLWNEIGMLWNWNGTRIDVGLM